VSRPERSLAFYERLPKVELHVHLEGSVRPETLLRLARRNRVDLPANSIEGLREWFTFSDFEHFVAIYLTISRCLRDPRDFQLLVDDFLAEQARQNVWWSEAHFTISTHITNGANAIEIRDAVWEAISDGEKRHGVALRLIPDIVRNLGWKPADRTIEWALESRRHGVVALGLAGIEKGFSNDPYVEHFAVAAREGLHRVAHAGEHAGPESVRDVLAKLAPERIGHGVRAAEDPTLVAELAERRIPVEVCPTSNVCLGVFPDLASHSFDRLLQGGVAVSVNSDDPPLFNTTLSAEYQALQRTFGYSDRDLARLALAALEHSFAPPEVKAELGRRMRAEYAAMGIAEV
jgi:adenosine deaminase